MNLVLAAIIAVSLPLPAKPLPPPVRQTPVPAERPIQVATICFSKGEQVSGMNKICYYDCLGSLTAITIGATQLCPLTINR